MSSLCDGGILKILENADELQMLFYCPGCQMPHGVRTRGKEPRWDYRGPPDAPTFSPSVLVGPMKHGDKERFPSGDLRCHSFVRNGMIEFLSDCTHALAGKTVPMERFKYAPDDEPELTDA